MVKDQPIDNLVVDTIMTYYDRAERFGPPQKIVSKVLQTLMDKKNSGWFLTFTFTKK
jgi:alkylated DNA nucleotide flippase Atl1